MELKYIEERYLLVDNEAVRIWKKDGIVFAEYKPNLYIDMEVAKLTVKSRKQVTNGINFPVLIDIRNLKRVEEDARKYLASDEAAENVKAGAIIKDGLIVNLLANWYLSVDKPPFPTRMFGPTQIKGAMRWLALYKTEQVS